MRPARGLTIIEVLIAMAIVMGMAAIVVPTVAARFDQRVFEAAIDQTHSMLLMARAHAQMTSRPVEVVYEPGQSAGGGQRFGRVIARHFDLEDPDAIAALRASSQGEDDDPQFDDLSARAATPLGRHDTVDDTTTIYEPWAVLELPGDAWIQRQMPEVLEAIAGESLPDTAGRPTLDGAFDDASTQDDQERIVRLAVFLPDGSLLAGQSTWLVDDGPRVARIDVNPWSGLPEVQLIRTATEAQSQLDQRDAADSRDDPRPDDEPADDDSEFSGTDALDAGATNQGGQ